MTGFPVHPRSPYPWSSVITITIFGLLAKVVMHAKMKERIGIDPLNELRGNFIGNSSYYEKVVVDHPQFTNLTTPFLDPYA